MLHPTSLTLGHDYECPTNWYFIHLGLGVPCSRSNCFSSKEFDESRGLHNLFPRGTKVI